MKVKELTSVIGGGIYLQYIEKFNGEAIDSARLTGRERIKLLNREVYLVFPTDDPKVITVSVY